VKAGSPITDLAGLSGKTVMTQADSAALEVLSDPEGKKNLADTFASLQTIGDYNNAFMQLDSGMVDAVACDLSIAQYQLAANPSKYVKLDEALSSEHYGVGFAKSDTETPAKVTQALKELDEDGTVKKLCEKYAEYGMDYSNWVLK
jgi:polar amino acid transport system substrate-binding protein